MHKPIIGSEALASGTLTRGALRWNYTAILPDVYIHRDAQIDWYARAMAAWLWTGRRGVLAGRTAATLYGVRPVDETAPIEVIAPPRRRRPGLVVRNERIEPDEVNRDGLARTTPARTALDLARRLPRDEAVVLLDKLSAVTDVTAADVAPLRARYRRARGMGSAAGEAITLMDGGSRSKEETLLRLTLMDSYLPPPSTSIFVEDDFWNAITGEETWGVVVALGWPDAKVGVEWAAHRRSLVPDVQFRELLRQKGWVLIEVMPQHTRAHTINRCWEALRRRGRV
ncbi:hypothetical protein [Mycolicibacterium vanbaalenii]|nr:hypothetical protein [Mycolicibacterium vanbaalenii]